MYHWQGKVYVFHGGTWSLETQEGARKKLADALEDISTWVESIVPLPGGRFLFPTDIVDMNFSLSYHPRKEQGPLPSLKALFDAGDPAKATPAPAQAVKLPDCGDGKVPL